MSWVGRTLGSSLGLKFLMAVTGILLVGFIISHLAANLLIFAGPEALAAYAQGLRKFPALLWIARLGLIGAFVVHIWVGIKLTRLNRAARPEQYAKKKFVRASFASRSMALSGLMLLFFLLYHLAHFTFRWTHPEYAELGPFELYPMLVSGFSSVPVSVLYIISVGLLGLHLSHGISSLFQTLGLNHRKYKVLVRSLGPVLGVIIAVGFASIPLAVLFGFVGS